MEYAKALVYLEGYRFSQQLHRKTPCTHGSIGMCMYMHAYAYTIHVQCTLLYVHVFDNISIGNDIFWVDAWSLLDSWSSYHSVINQPVNISSLQQHCDVFIITEYILIICRCFNVYKHIQNSEMQKISRYDRFTWVYQHTSRSSRKTQVHQTKIF